MIVHRNIRVEGVVQGVWYRDFTKKKALHLCLVGFVMNKVDKSVYIEVEGDEDSIDEFILWCHNGSPNAIVTTVIVHDDELVGFHDFQIKYI